MDGEDLTQEDQGAHISPPALGRVSSADAPSETIFRNPEEKRVDTLGYEKVKRSLRVIDVSCCGGVSRIVSHLM